MQIKCNSLFCMLRSINKVLLIYLDSEIHKTPTFEPDSNYEVTKHSKLTVET